MPLFRPLAPLAARWDAADGTGLEHLNLKPDGDRIVADSVVIGGRGGVPYGVRYRIVCRSDWTVVSLDGFAADLTVDEDGLVIDYPQLFRRVAVQGSPASDT